MEKERAVIYARVSTEEQNENQQIDPCLNYISDNDLDLVGTYKEKISAYKRGGKYRTEFNRLLDDGRKGLFKHIVVWNFDRMFRNHKQAIETIRGYSKPPYNLKFHFLNVPLFNNINKLQAPLNFMLYDFLLHYEAWRSEDESKIKSERVKKAYAVSKKKWGRPAVSKYKTKKVLSLRKHKLPMREIAKRTSLSVSAVHKIITQNPLTKEGEK